MCALSKELKEKLTGSLYLDLTCGIWNLPELSKQKFACLGDRIQINVREPNGRKEVGDKKQTIKVLSKESFRKSDCHGDALHVTGSITVNG